MFSKGVCCRFEKNGPACICERAVTAKKIEEHFWYFDQRAIKCHAFICLAREYADFEENV